MSTIADSATYIHDLLAEVEPPKGGILSRTLFTDSQIKLVLFAFDAGQELSEHTAAIPAIVHILAGEGTLIVGTDTVEARPGTWLHMLPRTPHSLRAETPMVMLLTLLK
ncbi:MAG: cupin domain-containing protein [Chloroflexales bacterium]|nr:cupin domain-containing protein [Chloroflexales bacterium]